MSKGRTKTKSRAILFFVILGVIIFGPVFVASILYNSRSFVAETLNYGHLILPPLQLQNLTMTSAQGQRLSAKKLSSGDWLMLYVNPRSCAKACQDNLYKMRQIRKALGKNMNRVKRVILTLSNKKDAALNSYLQKGYQGTIEAKTNKQALQQFLTPLPSKELALTQGYLYLVDPHGNVMMSYDAGFAPKGILKDMKRLLKASQIG